MQKWGWIAALAMAFATPAAAQAFDPAPWLADLEQARQAFHRKYANLEWLEGERGVKLDPLFDDLAKRLNRAQSEAQAMSVFNRLTQKLGDGHVEIDWPEPKTATAARASTPAAPPPDLCRTIGYDARQNHAGTAQALPGYAALPSTATDPFDAGIVDVAGTRIGILRIGIFMPQGYPALCDAAVHEFSIRQDKPCDDECEDKVLTWAYRRMTAALEERVRALKAAGATVLLVDIANNGGGSEWAEAAVRIVSPRPLRSERLGFVRGEHWAKQWGDLRDTLTDFAKKAKRQDRANLLGWAADAEAARREALADCSNGRCSRLGTAGYATGLVGSAPAGAFAGKDWGVYVFSPAQYPYHDSVWDRPLIVLTDQETWSAAEEFAAVLQDNKAAVVLGARSGGAGCGYTYGGTPTKLANSGAMLKLPDCVRFRADGSNEVRGIIPDEPVGLRANDGLQLRAKLVAERLPAAISRARALLAEAGH